MNNYIYTTRPKTSGFLGIKTYGKMLIASILLTALVIVGMSLVAVIRGDDTQVTMVSKEVPFIVTDDLSNDDVQKQLKETQEMKTNLEKQNRYLTSLVSRGETRKTRPILDYDKLRCPTYLVQLMETMSAKHGFPTIATVYCIAEYESKFDPTCWTTKGEDSRGLLQVNVACSAHAKRNPNKTKLFDPAYNLDYQLDELKDYYDQGKKKGLKGADLIIYVSRYGQRPKWKEWIADRIRASYKEYLNAVVSDGRDLDGQM